MNKSIIIFECNRCKKPKFFGIEDKTKYVITYKCRECGRLIDFDLNTMEKIR